MKIFIRQATNGEFYWIIKARNGQIVGSSLGEFYTSKSSCIRIVKKITNNQYPVVMDIKTIEPLIHLKGVVAK